MTKLVDCWIRKLYCIIINKTEKNIINLIFNKLNELYLNDHIN